MTSRSSLGIEPLAQGGRARHVGEQDRDDAPFLAGGAAVGSPTGLPHAGQNRAPSGTSDPQRGHARVKEAPHAAQKRAPAGSGAADPHVFTASESIVRTVRPRGSIP